MKTLPFGSLYIFIYIGCLKESPDKWTQTENNEREMCNRHMKTKNTSGAAILDKVKFKGKSTKQHNVSLFIV